MGAAPILEFTDQCQHRRLIDCRRDLVMQANGLQHLNDLSAGRRDMGDGCFNLLALTRPISASRRWSLPRQNRRWEVRLAPDS